MKSPFLTQVGFFKPVMSGLLDAGVNLDAMLKKSSLTAFDLEDDESFVPASSIYQFLHLVSEHESIEDLTSQFRGQFQLASLANYGENLLYTPDVLSAAQFASKYNQISLNQEVMSLHIQGNQATVYSHFIDDSPSPGRELAIHMAVAYALDALRVACGSDWDPDELHLQTATVPDFGSLLSADSKTRIFVNQPASAIVFPLSVLSKAMGDDASRVSQPELDLDTDGGLRVAIERVVDSTRVSIVPALSTVASLLNVPVRTLQRNLEAEDVTFKEIVENWRFKKAVKLLQDPSLRVKDISEHLRYSDVANFDRAFRRWTNTTPRLYRENL